ncbi:alpha/beta fold hydrolase [Geodermatophilus sp. SYSU D00691]
MDTVTVDGVRVAYERAGTGPTLVLLHGYVGDGPTTWRHQLEDLCDRFTVVAWDAPGAGASADPPEHFGMAGYADCLAGFVDRLGLDHPHVAGLSFGGALAIAVAGRHPGLPRSLVLASAYAGWRGSLPDDVATARLQQALALSELPAEQLVATLLPSMFSPTTPEADVSAFAAAMQAFHPVGFRAMARASAEDLSDVLPRIDVPTLLVHGGSDVRAPRAVADALHAAIRGSRLVVLPGTGHVCNVEAAAAFDREVRAFLAGVAGG